MARTSCLCLHSACLFGALGSPAGLMGEGSPPIQEGAHPDPVLLPGGGTDTAWESVWFPADAWHPKDIKTSVKGKKLSLLECQG